LAAAVAILAGCAAKAPPEDTCKAPDFTAHATGTGYAAQKEAVTLCVRKAAFAMAKAGGDISHAGDKALAQCKTEEDAVGKSGPDKLYDWQRQELHESLAHAGQITAAQARSLGCGRAPGAPKDTV
jgi:hypothetical protein